MNKKRHKCTNAFYCRMKRHSGQVRASEIRDMAKEIHAKNMTVQNRVW